MDKHLSLSSLIVLTPRAAPACLPARTSIGPKRACLTFSVVLISSVTAWVLRKLACSTCSCWC